MAVRSEHTPQGEEVTKRPAKKRGRPATPPEVVRARLFEAAERCFERESYASVGVLDIVAEAGMSSRSFYQHFDGKIDLACQLASERADAYLEGVERAAAEATTILEGIDATLTGFLTDLPLVVLELRHAGGSDGDRMRATLDGYRPRMGAAFLREFARAKQMGLVDEIPDPVGVLIVVYGIESLVTQVPRGPGRRQAMLALKPRILEAVRKLFPEWLENPQKIR